MDDTRAAQIRARLQAATPGPWSAADEHGLMPGATPAWCISRLTPNGGYMYDVADIPQGGDPAQEQADADLIAHAPTDLADLLAERETLLAVVEAALAYAKPESGDTTCGDLACEYCAFVRAVRAYRATTGEAGRSIVCMDPQHCQRTDHAAGAGGTLVHLPPDGKIVPGLFDHGVPSDATTGEAGQ